MPCQTLSIPHFGRCLCLIFCCLFTCPSNAPGTCFLAFCFVGGGYVVVSVLLLCRTIKNKFKTFWTLLFLFSFDLTFFASVLFGRNSLLGFAILAYLFSWNVKCDWTYRYTRHKVTELTRDPSAPNNRQQEEKNKYRKRNKKSLSMQQIRLFLLNFYFVVFGERPFNSMFWSRLWTVSLRLFVPSFVIYIFNLFLFGFSTNLVTFLLFAADVTVGRRFLSASSSPSRSLPLLLRSILSLLSVSIDAWIFGDIDSMLFGLMLSCFCIV